MAEARKITLAEAAESGAVGLSIYCLADPVAGGGCRHSAAMGLGEAVARFGPERRLDALPFRCSACGRREIDVRPDWGPVTSGGLPLT